MIGPKEPVRTATIALQIYVANVDAGTVVAIVLDGGQVSRAIAIGREVHGLDLSDDGGTLFVSGRGENKLAAVDLNSGATHTSWPGLSAVSPHRDPRHRQALRLQP